MLFHRHGVCAALLALGAAWAATAAAQPANVPTESERGSGSQMSRQPKAVTQPSTREGEAIRSNPGGLGKLGDPMPSAPGGKDEPSPRTQASGAAPSPPQAPLKGRERKGSGGAAIDQAREPSTDPRESGAR